MTTLGAMLRSTVRQHGDRTAIHDDERCFTYREFADRVARVAGVLQTLGVKTGDRYGIISRNSFRVAELLYGGYWLGAVPVPVNYRLAPPEIRHVLDDSGCKALAVEEAFWELLNSAEIAPWKAGALCVSDRPAPVPNRQYEALLAATPAAAPQDVGENDLAILLYTGGTTGRGKGVRLSHRNVLSNALQLARPLGVRAEDVYLHVAPMFHSADVFATAFWMYGAGHCFLPAFSGRAVLKAIERHRITFAMMPPTMIIMTLEEPDIDKHDLSSFRRLFYGASPMAVEWIQRAMKALPSVELQQAYGLTETSPILTILSPEDHVRALETGNLELLKSAGRPVACVEMKIVDDEDRGLPTGAAGEVVVRGPNVMQGYLNLEEKTREALRGGWFHTGDVGRLDEAGYLYLLDRKNDLVITGGENVYSAEVEAVLYQHPGVHEAAVIGVPDDRLGEALFAVIVPAPGATLTEQEIINHCRGKIGGYKVPRRMAFVDVLPKSAMGKILKTELRRAFAAGKAP